MEHKILLELTEISNFFLAKPWFFSQTSIILFHIFHGVSFVVLNYMFRLQRRSEHNAVIRRYSCVCGIQTVRILCVGRRSVLPFFRKHKWWMIANIVCHDLSCGGRRMSRMSRSLGYVVSILKKGGCFEKLMFWDAWTPGKKKHLYIHVVFPPPSGSRLAKEFASHHWAIGPQLQQPKNLR